MPVPVRSALRILIAALSPLLLTSCWIFTIFGPGAASTSTSATYNFSFSSAAAGANAAGYLYLDVPDGWDLTGASYDATVDSVNYVDEIPTELGPTDGPCGAQPPPPAGYHRLVFASQVFPTLTATDSGSLDLEFMIDGGSGMFTLRALTGGGDFCKTDDEQTLDVEVFGDPLAPSAELAFSPAAINEGGTSTLSIELLNLNETALSGIAFNNAYPAGLVNAATPNATTTCAGGSVTAAAGANSVVLSGASLAGQSSCIVTVDVTAAAVGSYDNSIVGGGITTDEISRPNLASNTATLDVAAAALAAPTVAKAFAPGTIVVGGAARLTVTLSNPNGSDITGVAFTDTYPAGLVNADPPNVVSTCGGTVTGTAGSASLALSDGTIPASSNCAVSIDVTATTAGSFVNEIAAGDVTSDNALPNAAGAASAPLVAAAAPGAVAGVPTTGEWGLILLAAALGLLALRAIRG